MAAEPFVLPPQFAAPYGGIIGGGSAHTQLLYNASYIPLGATITEVDFRPALFGVISGGTFTPTTWTASDVEIRLGYTSTVGNSFDTTGPLTLVRSGPITMSTSFTWAILNVSAVFDIRVPFSTPFIGSGGGSYLVIDIQNLGTGGFWGAGYDIARGFDEERPIPPPDAFMVVQDLNGQPLLLRQAMIVELQTVPEPRYSGLTLLALCAVISLLRKCQRRDGHGSSGLPTPGESL